MDYLAPLSTVHRSLVPSWDHEAYLVCATLDRISSESKYPTKTIDNVEVSLDEDGNGGLSRIIQSCGFVRYGRVRPLLHVNSTIEIYRVLLI